MIDRNGEKLRYSIDQRMQETERKRHQKVTVKRKDWQCRNKNDVIKDQTSTMMISPEEVNKVIGYGGKTVKKLEAEMTEYSSRSINIDEFKMYIKKVSDMYEKTRDLYERASIRKWKM